jgi:hypothetical protein
LPRLFVVENFKYFRAPSRLKNLVSIYSELVTEILLGNEADPYIGAAQNAFSKTSLPKMIDISVHRLVQKSMLSCVAFYVTVYHLMDLNLLVKLPGGDTISLISLMVSHGTALYANIGGLSRQ